MDIQNLYFTLCVFYNNLHGGGNMFEEQFCERITQLRLEKGVSARDMSLTLGQSESYINRIESKKMLPSMSVFFIYVIILKSRQKSFFL